MSSKRKKPASSLSQKKQKFDHLHCFFAKRDFCSNWHPSPFEEGGIRYNCVEQFMMAEKARLFQDTATLDKIMKEEDPKIQKKLGRKVSNFDSDTWDSHREGIVFRGCLAKFSQNKALKQALLATGTRTLVEASPYDKIWGVGLKASDTRIQDPGKWKGLNLLGKCLEKVRSTLGNKK